MTVRLMSDGELTRLEVLRDLDQRRLTTEAAARLLRLERRQVFRLLKAYRTTGPAGLISKRRGRRSNRRKPEALRNAALAIIREWYWDFGPTLAAEKLREVHGITLGRALSSRLGINYCFCTRSFTWIQLASATFDLKAAISSAMVSAGVFHPSVLRGRPFMSRATSLSQV